MGRGLPTFAVRFGETPYGFIGRFQAFNGNGKEAALIARELFDAFRKGKQTKNKMTRVLIELFEESGTYAQAKIRVGHLEDLDEWDPSFSARISAAAQANSQIRDATGVPHRVEALTKKWAKSAI